MHRCYLEQTAPLAPGQQLTLSTEESAHVSRVLRMRAGETVQLIAAERLYEAELTAPDERAAQVTVRAELPSPEARAQVTLVQGLPKADKLEWIIQKATELGCREIWPVDMERSIAKQRDERKRDRWQRIALEAAKQSGRAHVPQVADARTLAQTIEQLQGFDAVFVAWEEEKALPLSAAMRSFADAAKPPRLALVIGPEGGISPAEIERLQAAGARCVTLGRRILRTETAGLCGLSVMMCMLGEM